MRASNPCLTILAQPRALFATIHDFPNSHFAKPSQASAPLIPCLYFREIHSDYVRSYSILSDSLRSYQIPLILLDPPRSCQVSLDPVRPSRSCPTQAKAPPVMNLPCRIMNSGCFMGNLLGVWDCLPPFYPLLSEFNL